MVDLVSGNAAIGQSGGPTAVINQSLAGVIEGLKSGLISSGKVKRILGMRHGVRGIVKPGAEGLVDLTSIPADRLDRLASTPSAALGSTRDKPDEAYCQKILDGARANDIRFYWTPTNASWTNRIEAQFTPLKKFVLDNTDYESHAEMQAAIRRYLAWRNRRRAISTMTWAAYRRRRAA